MPSWFQGNCCGILTICFFKHFIDGFQFLLELYLRPFKISIIVLHELTSILINTKTRNT